MISTLVNSALQTGCLSVASESLIRQVMETAGYQASDLEALKILDEAINSGQIQREARSARIRVSLKSSL
ncbi:hypothetical protein [Lyngbya aestuarii]|uniref:hypothetical protein n=1 Tax=Lyngbya aestuarii TaxID=118322 RepID=UPI00403D5F6A